MRKQEYKEQEQKRPRRYYFFDYLFWLGEMAQQHYKGEPRRPDGDSMLMLCIMVVVLGPIITIVLCFDPPVRDFLAIAMIICSVVIVYLPRQDIFTRSAEGGHAALCGTQVQPCPVLLFPVLSWLFAYRQYTLMGNSAEMDRQNYQMTDSRNVFCRFFYILVMLHKIMHSHFTDWNNKRKRKALGAGIYALTILPELLLLNGTLFAAAGQDGYVHLESDCQKVVFYGVSVLALLLMVIPLGFLDDKKIRKEVRQELRERPRYWKRAMLIYIAAIVALVVAVNIAFPYL